MALPSPSKASRLGEKHINRKEAMDLLRSEMLLRKSFFDPNLLVEGVQPSVSGQEALTGKIVGIFYSASWCPPCLGFVSRLVSFYTTMRERNLPFEVVFVSCDSSQEAMQSYFLELQGDWLAFPFEKELKRQALLNMFDIVCIPKLIVITEEGTVVSSHGRRDVAENRQTKLQLFHQWQAVAKAEQAAAEEKRLLQLRQATQEQDKDELASISTPRRRPTEITRQSFDISL